MKTARTSPGILVGAVLLLTVVAAPAHAIGTSTRSDAASHTRQASRPDAWLKICGAGDTCNHAPPHRYFGDNVYNTSGARQTVSSGVEEANDLRFWLRMENDGGSDDTIYVKGCTGNTAFVLRAVLVGAFTQSTNAENVTRPFKRGTAHFDLQANDADSVVLTIDLWARTPTAGARYTCSITIWSSAQPSMKDTVVAKMVTCYRNCVAVEV
jgi:hypothetical protein